MKNFEKAAKNISIQLEYIKNKLRQENSGTRSDWFECKRKKEIYKKDSKNEPLLMK